MDFGQSLAAAYTAPLNTDRLERDLKEYLARLDALERKLK